MPVSLQSRISMPKLPGRDKGDAVPRSQAERLWLIGGGLVAFVLVLIGYFFFISPQRSQTKDIKSQTAAAKQQNAVLQARIDALRVQNKDLARYQAEYAQARLALPTTSGISDFLRTLQSLGNATHTDVTSLSVSAPISVNGPASASQPSGQAQANPSATSEAAAGQPSAAAPTSSTTGVYALPITATVTGTPTNLEQFVYQLQAVQPRAVLITEASQSVGVVAAGGSGSTTLNLTMEAFVAPSSPSEGASLSSAAAQPSSSASP